MRHDRALASPQRAGSSTILEGRVARTHGPGNPLVYTDGPEYRDASELASIARQLPGTPIRLGHSNPRVVGVVTAGRVEGDHAVATMRITDADALAAIADGTRELSLGYDARLDETRFQRDIKLDHLAIVPVARCGATCSIKADCAECSCKVDAPACTLASGVPNHRSNMADEPNTLKIAQDAIQAQAVAERARDAAVAAIAVEKARADAAEGTAATLREQLKAADALRRDDAAHEALENKVRNLEALVVAEKTRADAAESPDRLRKAVAARVAIETSASIVLGDKRLDGFGDRELMEVVIDKLVGKASIAPGTDGKARSDEYVSAVFTTAIDGYRGSAAALNRLREAVQPADPTPRGDSRSARDQMEQRNRNAWKPAAPAGSK